MLGQGVFGTREVPLPNEVAVHITEDDGGNLIGVVVPPGVHGEVSSTNGLPAGPGLFPRPAPLAINDGIRKAQTLQAPLVIVDLYGVWSAAWGELRPH